MLSLKQERETLRLSLRDAAAIAGVSYEQLRKAELRGVGDRQVEEIRAKYREDALALISKLTKVAQ